MTGPRARGDTANVALALRPSFSVDLSVPSREAIDRISRALSAGSLRLRRTRPPGGGRDTSARAQEHLALTVPAEQQHFWSPWLNIDISPRDGGTHVFARFSPHPSVWTGYMFGYLILTVVVVISLVVVAAGTLVEGGSQLWALWVTGGAALAMAGMWWASQVGQRLARAQMEELRAAFDRALETCQPAGA